MLNSKKCDYRYCNALRLDDRVVAYRASKSQVRGSGWAKSTQPLIPSVYLIPLHNLYQHSEINEILKSSVPLSEYFSSSLHAEIVEVEIEVVSPSIVPSGNFAELNRTVTCMVLKANDRCTSCPCHEEFRGHQKTTTTTSLHSHHTYQGICSIGTLNHRNQHQKCPTTSRWLSEPQHRF
ncbi:hypothetical protein TNCV_94301 [Trichonephila clavipes]|nr:hypothetical protein TNCV_94301 [Trichonephila clavipes]